MSVTLVCNECLSANQDICMHMTHVCVYILYTVFLLGCTLHGANRGTVVAAQTQLVSQAMLKRSS